MSSVTRCTSPFILIYVAVSQIEIFMAHNKKCISVRHVNHFLCRALYRKRQLRSTNIQLSVYYDFHRNHIQTLYQPWSSLSFIHVINFWCFGVAYIMLYSASLRSLLNFILERSLHALRYALLQFYQIFVPFESFLLSEPL